MGASASGKGIAEELRRTCLDSPGGRVSTARATEGVASGEISRVAAKKASGIEASAKAADAAALNALVDAVGLAEAQKRVSSKPNVRVSELLARHTQGRKDAAKVQAHKDAAKALAIERARLATEALPAAEDTKRARLKAEATERTRLATEARLAAEAATRARLAAEFTERARLTTEARRLRIEARLAVEARARLAADERARVAAETATRHRLAVEAQRVEQANTRTRLRAEAVERARLATEARIADEAATRVRLAAEARERARLAAEAEERLARCREEEERAVPPPFPLSLSPLSLSIFLPPPDRTASSPHTSPGVTCCAALLRLHWFSIPTLVGIAPLNFEVALGAEAARRDGQERRERQVQAGRLGGRSHSIHVRHHPVGRADRGRGASSGGEGER